MYRCCIFDLDGTLVNSLEALRYTTSLTLAKYGYGPITIDQTKVFVGDGYKKLMERALLACGDEKLEHYEDSLTTYMEYFRIHCLREVKPYDGIPELLAFLKENKIKAAVVSNKPHQQALDNIAGVFGDGIFDLVTGEKEGVNRKPDPAAVFNTMKALGVKPEECLYLGDTDTDMKTGLAAGADTVGVTWGFRDRVELESFHPQFVVDAPEEVIKIIKKEHGLA